MINKILSTTVKALVLSGLMISPVAMADTISLGAAVSLSGKYSTAGNHTKKGYDLAVKYVNSMGGVSVGGKVYDLEIIYYDDESTPARGASLAERLILRDGVSFMLGPYSSGLTKAIAPVTEKHGVPMVEANGASRSLFNQGYKYMFAVLSTSEQYLQEAVNQIAEKAGKPASEITVALAIENDPFSQDIRAGVIDDVKRHGMQIVIDDKLPRDLSDMTSTLVKVKALKPDLLVLSGHSKGAALVVRQMNDLGVHVKMLAMTHCESAKLDDKEKFGNLADYALCAAQWAPTVTSEGLTFGTASNYTQIFVDEYGYTPPYQAAESTAAVLVMADALSRAGSLDKDAVRDALAATDMSTFYGKVKFSEAGNNIAKPMLLRQLIDGKYYVVAPANVAETDLVYPRP
jgi:branched-chain amino acid transport system substrate-binding protein